MQKLQFASEAQPIKFSATFIVKVLQITRELIGEGRM